MQPCSAAMTSLRTSLSVAKFDSRLLKLLCLHAVLDEELHVVLEAHRLEHLAHVLDRPRGRLQREPQLAQRRHLVTVWGEGEGEGEGAG